MVPSKHASGTLLIGRYTITILEKVQTCTLHDTPQLLKPMSYGVAQSISFKL